MHMLSILLFVAIVAADPLVCNTQTPDKSSDELALRIRTLELSQKEALLVLAKAEHKLALAYYEKAKSQYDGLFQGLDPKPGVSREDQGLALLAKLKCENEIVSKREAIQYTEIDIRIAEIEVSEAKLRIENRRPE